MHGGLIATTTNIRPAFFANATISHGTYSGDPRGFAVWVRQCTTSLERNTQSSRTTVPNWQATPPIRRVMGQSSQCRVRGQRSTSGAYATSINSSAEARSGRSLVGSFSRIGFHRLFPRATAPSSSATADTFPVPMTAATSHTQSCCCHDFEWPVLGGDTKRSDSVSDALTGIHRWLR
jgi:hypothetical protein